MVILILVLKFKEVIEINNTVVYATISINRNINDVMLQIWEL